MANISRASRAWPDGKREVTSFPSRGNGTNSVHRNMAAKVRRLLTNCLSPWKLFHGVKNSWQELGVSLQLYCPSKLWMAYFYNRLVGYSKCVCIVFFMVFSLFAWTCAPDGRSNLARFSGFSTLMLMLMSVFCSKFVLNLHVQCI